MMENKHYFEVKQKKTVMAAVQQLAFLMGFKWVLGGTKPVMDPFNYIYFQDDRTLMYGNDPAKVAGHEDKLLADVPSLVKFLMDHKDPEVEVEPEQLMTAAWLVSQAQETVEDGDDDKPSVV